MTRWIAHLTCMVKKECVQLLSQITGLRDLHIGRRIILKSILIDIICEVCTGFNQFRIRVKWLALVNTVMEFLAS
jgi:hypothetical protein